MAPIRTNARTPKNLHLETLEVRLNPQGLPILDQVSHFYQVALDRAPDPQGLAYYSSQVEYGAAPQSVARQILNSTEHHQKIVTGYYNDILGRQPDASGLASHVAALGRGVGEERLVASFLASPEKSGGLTNTAYVNLLYSYILGRTPEQSGEEFWVSALQSGATRQAVAMAFLQSREATNLAVDGLYQSVLGRQPTGSEKQGWINYLRRPDVTYADAAAAFLASSEAAARLAGVSSPLLTVTAPNPVFWQKTIGLGNLDGAQAPAAQLKLNPVVQLSHFGQDIAFTETQTGITSIPINNPGAGYPTGKQPSIIKINPPKIPGVNNVTATATAVVSDGVLSQSGLKIGNNNHGAYLNSSPKVTITDTNASPGSGAVITLHVNGDGNVDYINNFSGGTGYHPATTTIKVTGARNAQGELDPSLDVTITITSTGIVDGAISAIEITNSGSGYAVGESVQITVEPPTPTPGGPSVVPATLGQNGSVTAGQYEGPSETKFQAWAKDYITYVANTGVSTCFINIGDYKADTKGLYNYLRPELGTNGIPWIVTDFLDPLANLKKPDGTSAVEVGAIAYLKDAWHLYEDVDNPNFDGNLLISDGKPSRTEGSNTVYSPPKNNMYQALQLVNEINSYASTKFITHFEFDGEGGGTFVQDDPAKSQPSFYGFNTSTSDTDPQPPSPNWTYDPSNPSASNWPTTGPGYTKWLWNHLMPGVVESDLALGGLMPGSRSGSPPSAIPNVVFTDTQALDPQTWSENGAKPYQFGSISYSQPAWFPSSPGPVQSYSENYWWGENNYMPGDSSALWQNPNGPTTFKTTDTTSYSSEPIITFNTPAGGNPAAGYAVLNASGAIDHIVVTRFGDHYQLTGPNSPSYSVNGGPSIPVPSANAVDTTTYNRQYAPIWMPDGSIIINGNGLSLVNVTVAGGGYSAGAVLEITQTTYDLPPDVLFTNAAGDTTGSGAQAFVTLDSSGKISGIQITNPGTGYTAEPTISFRRAAGDKQTAPITDTAVAWVINYPRVTVTPGAFSPTTEAVAYAVMAPVDKSLKDYNTGYAVSSIEFSNPGAGYLPAATGSALPKVTADQLPTITVSAPPAGTSPNGTQARADGQVAIVNKWNAFWVDGLNSITSEIGSADTARLESVGSVTVSNPGSGYGWDAQVTFSAPENPGETAVGYVVLNSDSSVNRIAITNPGSGYSSPPMAIVSSPGNIGGGALLSVDPLVPKIRGGGNVYNYEIWNGTGSTGANQIFSVNSADAVYAHYAAYPESLAQMFNDPKYTAEPSLKKLSDRSYQQLNLNQDYTQITQSLPGKGISQGAIATFSLESVLLSNTGAAAVANGAGGGATAFASQAGGKISSITVTHPGAKYLVPPLVQILDSKGSGASATATLATDGTVSGITITAGGAGYTSPTVTLISQGACLDAKYQDPSQLLGINALGGTFGGLSMLTYDDFITFLNTAADIVVGSQKASGINLQSTDYTVSGLTITSAVADFQNIRKGMTVEGVGVPAGTVVTANPVPSGNSFSVTLSNPVTGNPALTFYNPISASDVTFSIYDCAFLPLSWLDGQVANGWKEANTAPKFSGLLTAGTVAPNALAGTVIHTEVATDNDLLAANKRITYDLKRGLADDARLLRINPSTGQVMLRYDASHFPRQSYTFTVVATDGGGLSVQKTVTVPVVYT